MGDKRNMIVSVTVMVDFVQGADGSWKADANYSGSSLPPALPGKTVVGSDGTIDLTAINRDKNQYTKNSDIRFYLGGNATTFHFPFDPANPTDASQAIEIFDDKDKVKYSAAMVAGDPWYLVLTDEDTSGDRAGYQLYVYLEPAGAGSGIKLPIDPVIINRGVGD